MYHHVLPNFCFITSVYNSVIFVCVSAGVDIYTRKSKDNFPKSFSPFILDSRDPIQVLRLVLQVIDPPSHLSAPLT